jgi:hypothetical protein
VIKIAEIIDINITLTHVAVVAKHLKVANIKGKIRKLAARPYVVNYKPAATRVAGDPSAALTPMSVNA